MTEKKKKKKIQRLKFKILRVKCTRWDCSSHNSLLINSSIFSSLKQNHLLPKKLLQIRRGKQRMSASSLVAGSVWKTIESTLTGPFFHKIFLLFLYLFEFREYFETHPLKKLGLILFYWWLVAVTEDQLSMLVSMLTFVLQFV